jgi:hypothetical protein
MLLPQPRRSDAAAGPDRARPAQAGYWIRRGADPDVVDPRMGVDLPQPPPRSHRPSHRPS